MTDIEKLREFTDQIAHGWHERREYVKDVDGAREQRIEHVWQPPLASQLEEACFDSGSASGSGGGKSKPKSRAPGNEPALMLLSDLRMFLRTWIHDARILLGYDVPMREIADTVCGECEGKLIVADDASSDVICVGTESTESCGRRYPHWEWLELLAAQGESEDRA